MANSDKTGSPECAGDRESSSKVTHYPGDISRRWEKIHKDMAQLAVTGVAGTTIAEVYEKTPEKRTVPPDYPLPVVGFSCMTREPSDEEVKKLVDDAVAQVLGEKGLAAIIRPGDRVVIKVNIVGPSQGQPGEKGRGIISDPRIVRYVAEKVRGIIGFGTSADLKVVDATFTTESNPSSPENPQSFHHARLHRPGKEDICYDSDSDGILDGTSAAQLVNLDSVQQADRFLTVIDEPIRGPSEVWLPKFMRTREQAGGEPEYCDVLIGIPIFKSHGLCGMTGAVKLFWGCMLGLLEKQEHAGYGFGTGDIRLFHDYLCAMNRARGFDLVIMDALTGNRNGPANKVEDYDAKTDFILSNAVLCSKDSVAIDTVETLLGGYRLDTIPLLEAAFRDGIGINKPPYIDLQGFGAFCRHKQWLAGTYPCSGTGGYPLEDGWGNAKVDSDFMTPPRVSVTCRGKASGHDYTFAYTAQEAPPAQHGLARVDILVNGKVVRRIFDNLESGNVTVSLKEFSGMKVQFQAAAWDNVLNCTVTDGQDLSVE